MHIVIEDCGILNDIQRARLKRLIKEGPSYKQTKFIVQEYLSECNIPIYPLYIDVHQGMLYIEFWIQDEVDYG